MKTIALLGDSHAKVVFQTLKPLLIQKGFTPVFLRAENGWSLKKHIDNGSISAIRNINPDVILVSLGGNNMDMSAGKYKTTIDTLRRMAKDIKAKIVWVGPTTSSQSAPNTEKRHKITDGFLSKYIPTFGKYISMRSVTNQGWGKDGVHYHPSFYKKWARYVADKVDLPVKKKFPLWVLPALGLAFGTTFIITRMMRVKTLTQKTGSSNKAISQQNEIILYYLPGCPYCTGVQKTLSRLKLPYQLINVNIQANRDDMAQKRHNSKTSVPFAIINGKPVDESSNIVEELQSLL